MTYYAQTMPGVEEIAWLEIRDRLKNPHFLRYLFDRYRPIYAYIVALGVFPVAYYVIVRVHHERTGPQLERLSQLLKYDFLIWFAAVLLGAAV